jgi:hypothetical protein
MSAFQCLAIALLLAAIVAGGPAPSHAQQAPARGMGQASVDFRAAFRAQVEEELAQLRPRLAKAEADAKVQAERYKEMAASKAEMARKTAERAKAERAKADAAAAKKGYAPKLPGKTAGVGKAGGAKEAAAGAGDKGKSADKGKGGEGGAASAGEGGPAPKKIDPVLTQQYLVMSLRDEVRLLRERIVYLEGLLARM